MKCLIIGPSHTEYFYRVQKYLERTLLKKNIEVIGVDENISNMIENADIIIADLTDNNPNVFYEVGYAHALKKALIPIVEKSQVNIPSELQGTLYFAYDCDNLRIVGDQVIAWIKMYVEPYKLGETKI